MNATCPTRLLQPFLRFITERGTDHDLVPASFWSAEPDARVSLDDAKEMLDRAVERFEDERLGLKLGRTMRFGEGGAFDYAVQSAGTVRQSVDVAGRYSTLLADSFRIWYEPWHRYAVIRLLDEGAWSTAAADFTLCAFYKLHLADKLPAASQLECWFPYAAPEDVEDYRANFPGMKLKFHAPFFGFAFNRAYESAPMPGADPVLHPVHCRRVSDLLAHVATSENFSSRVRHAISQELRSARYAPGDRVARALCISRRTMNRRLEEEGTTFALEHDRVRRELGLFHIGESDASLVEVAFLLGFSHVESFHRAFKRWTGQTPLAYRARVQGGRLARCTGIASTAPAPVAAPG